MAKITKLPEAEVHEIQEIVTSKIKFINESLIPPKQFLYAEQLIGKVDPDDIPFVALTRHLRGKLWTGDKILSAALLQERFTGLKTTAQLISLINRKRK